MKDEELLDVKFEKIDDEIELCFGSGKLNAKISKNTAIKLLYDPNARLRQFICEACLKTLLSKGEEVFALEDFPNQEEMYQVLGQMLEKDKSNELLAKLLALVEELRNRPATEVKMANLLLRQRTDTEDAAKILAGLLARVKEPNADKIVKDLMLYIESVTNLENQKILYDALKSFLQKHPLKQKESLELLSTFDLQKAGF